MRCVIGNKQQSMEKASSFVRFEPASMTSEGKLITLGKRTEWHMREGERQRERVRARADKSMSYSTDWFFSNFEEAYVKHEGEKERAQNMSFQ